MILTHGINSIGGGNPVIDPTIILLFDGVSNYGLQPTSGVTPIIHYDANGPLDVSGMGWSGTPYVVNSELGGNATDLSQLHNNSHGIHYNQAELINLDNIGNEFTIDFWAYNLSTTSYGNSPTVMFSDGYSWVFMFTKWYGSRNVVSLYENGTDSNYNCIEQNSNKWIHYAVVQKSGKIKMFVNGTFAQETNDFSRTSQNIFTICSEYTSRGESRFAQVCVRNVAKWDSNFTPPTKPYILGE